MGFKMSDSITVCVLLFFVTIRMRFALITPCTSPFIRVKVIDASRIRQSSVTNIRLLSSMHNDIELINNNDGRSLKRPSSDQNPQGNRILSIIQNSTIKVMLKFQVVLLQVRIALLKIVNRLTQAGPFRKAGTLVRLSAVLFTRSVLTRVIAFTASFLAVTSYLSHVNSQTMNIPFSAFLKLISQSPERITALRVAPSAVKFLLDGRKAVAFVVSADSGILDRLIASGVDFAAAPTNVKYLSLLWTVGYGYFLWKLSSRMLQGPPDESVGKRRDLSATGGSGSGNGAGRLSFDDIAGQDRAKQEVAEVCGILRAPEKYKAIGARLPAGVLLVGPPGTGKTLLARITAAEAGVPFYACSASDFVEVFVGRGPARVRKLFKAAAENAPSVVFIDEIDSIGRSRKMGSLNTEQETTLNQILTCMDGLDTSNNGVIVMAATNRYELLDPALLRSGRFDRIINCPLPDKAGRQAILNVHTRKLILSPDVDLERIARLTPGTCGADLATIANEAAIRAVRRGGSDISAYDFDEALKSFYSARGISVSGLSELAGLQLQLPAWLKGFTNAPAPSTTNE